MEDSVTVRFKINAPSLVQTMIQELQADAEVIEITDTSITLEVTESDEFEAGLTAGEICDSLETIFGESFSVSTTKNKTSKS